MPRVLRMEIFLEMFQSRLGKNNILRLLVEALGKPNIIEADSDINIFLGADAEIIWDAFCCISYQQKNLAMDSKMHRISRIVFARFT